MAAGTNCSLTHCRLAICQQLTSACFSSTDGYHLSQGVSNCSGQTESNSQLFGVVKVAGKPGFHIESICEWWLQAHPTGLRQLLEWQGHDLEAWMATWDKHQVRPTTEQQGGHAHSAAAVLPHTLPTNAAVPFVSINDPVSSSLSPAHPSQL